MEIIIKPVVSDAEYGLEYKEAFFEGASEKKRVSLAKKLIKAYDLRLNDLKYDGEQPSNKLISFSRFYGETYFTVEYGLESINSGINRLINREQCRQLFGTLYKTVKGKDNLFAWQKFSIRQHLEIQNSSALDYLNSINPFTPQGFKSQLIGRGSLFQFAVPDHELKIHVLLTNSAIIEGGIYFVIDFIFKQNQYDFTDAFDISSSQYNFILNELNLNLDETNG
jgi:hypothetical protein